ncbi:MAG: CBS domain-containing protein [Candidatus Omnitrophota bacterium]|nr:CBS domain-containing protein [Candidatus Omnitrophota bacterium]
MTNNINEAGQKAAAMFVYLSEILKKDVLAADGKFTGAVWDISSKLGETYPKLSELIISKGFLKKTYASVPWSGVSIIEDSVTLNIKSDDIKFGPTVKNYEFLIRRDILDQQVVDTYNHKVRRVNDVDLLKVDHEYVIAHVDIGLRSLLRRLGWEKIVDGLIKVFHKDSRFLKKEELVSWKYIQPVSLNPASMTMKLSVSEKQMSSIPAADLGDIIFDLNTNQRMALFRTLDIGIKARVFENLDFEEQKIILKDLDKKEAAQIVTKMSSDEATDLLERLPSNTVKNLLTLIESNRAKKLSTLLGYSGDSAGGLMTTELVSMPETVSVEAAIDFVKNNTKEVETVPYIYIVDEKNRLKGVTTIRRLLFAEPKDNILKTVFPKTLYVYLNNSVKEVAYFMDKYKVSAIPVIDENKILHGIITMDDVLSQVISIAWRRRKPKSKGL